MRALEGGGFAAGVYEDPANLLIPPLAQPSLFLHNSPAEYPDGREKKKIHLLSLNEESDHSLCI